MTDECQNLASKVSLKCLLIVKKKNERIAQITFSFSSSRNNNWSESKKNTNDSWPTRVAHRNYHYLWFFFSFSRAFYQSRNQQCWTHNRWAVRRFDAIEMLVWLCRGQKKKEKDKEKKMVILSSIWCQQGMIDEVKEIFHWFPFCRNSLNTSVTSSPASSFFFILFLP